MRRGKTSKKQFVQIVGAVLICLGFWEFGHGAYIPAKAWIAQALMQRAWRHAEDGAPRPAPWPWADTSPVARLLAKGGDVRLIVLEGGSGRTLAFGPGHLGISAFPGEPGNSIIAGHRDTHFQFLKHLAVGEVVHMELPDGRQYDYEVMAIDVVDSRRGQLVLDTAEAMMSLVTCYPFDGIETGGPLRYVVSARMMR